MNFTYISNNVTRHCDIYMKLVRVYVVVSQINLEKKVNHFQNYMTMK